MEKESGVFGGAAKVDPRDFFQVDILHTVFDARFVDFEKFQVFGRVRSNESEEFNIGGYRDHDPIRVGVTNQVLHVFKRTRIATAKAHFHLALSLDQEFDGGEILGTNSKSDNLFHLSNKGAAGSALVVHQGQRIIVLRNGENKANLKFVGVVSVVIDFDQVLRTDVLAKYFAKAVDGGTHRIIVTHEKARKFPPWPVAFDGLS